MAPTPQRPIMDPAADLAAQGAHGPAPPQRNADRDSIEADQNIDNTGGPEAPTGN